MTFIRYVVIQLLAYALDIVGFLTALKFGLLGPVAANVLAKVVAGLFAFTVHRNFTFRAGGRADRTHQAFRYFILLALNVPVASGILAALLLWLNEPLIAKVFADVACVALTYWLSKSFIFIRWSKS